MTSQYFKKYKAERAYQAKLFLEKVYMKTKPKAKNPIIQWEYSHLSCMGDMHIQNLNKEGKDGWELVCVVYTKFYCHAYFKRLLKQLNENKKA